MDSVRWLFLVCAVALCTVALCTVALCTVIVGATDVPLEQGRINQLSVSVFLSACL